MSNRGSQVSGSEASRKRDKEYSASLTPEVLEEIRQPDNYRRLRDRKGSRIGSSSSSSGGGSSFNSGMTASERKRGNTTSSDGRSGGSVAALAMAMPNEKRDKFASGGRRDSNSLTSGGGGSGGSGGGRKEGRGVDSLPPALKEDLEIFKRELVKHMRKEMMRLKDDLIDDLRREFAAFRTDR